MSAKRRQELTNARKRKFLLNMTPEQKAKKQVKDRAYYNKMKADNKVKSITEMSEKEKEEQRKLWRQNTRKYREKKKSS